MQSRDFVYWLQGFFEISDAGDLDEAQTEIIRRHLNLVFKHEIDPAMGDKGRQFGAERKRDDKRRCDQAD